VENPDLDEPPAAANDRPPVPVGMHRRRHRRRFLIRCAWGVAWTLIGLSIVLAIFVHKGLLGITGLVGAVIVATVMLDPRRYSHWEDPHAREESPD
jgi:hypothetical protein